MNRIINLIKDDLYKLKSNYLAISFLLCSFIFFGILNTLIIIVATPLVLGIFLYFKDEFDFQKAKEYFTNKKDN